MKTNLYAKCKTCDFQKILESKGYSYFTKGEYNLNIIGVRSDNNNAVTNLYDDFLVLLYKTSKGWTRRIFNITTEPGLRYMKNPTNSKGVAILVPGQYKGIYKIDLHNGKYQALCQRNGPVKVYRDNNKDDVYDMYPKTTDTGMFGINIHRSNETYTRQTIDSYSAGCQVFNDPQQFLSFMNAVRKASTIWGNKFTYTLLDEKDLDAYE